ARYYAGLNYEKTGDFVGAIRNYGAVLAFKGKGNDKLKQDAQRFMAFLYEKSGQYARAAQAFEDYAERFPKDSSETDFYYNAAVIQSGLNLVNSAVKNFERYYQKSKKDDRREVFFLMAQIWEKRGNGTKAISYYEQYINSGGAVASNVVE